MNDECVRDKQTCGSASEVPASTLPPQHNRRQAAAGIPGACTGERTHSSHSWQFRPSGGDAVSSVCSRAWGQGMGR